MMEVTETQIEEEIKKINNAKSKITEVPLIGKIDYNSINWNTTTGRKRIKELSKLEDEILNCINDLIKNKYNLENINITISKGQPVKENLGTYDPNDSKNYRY